MIIKVDNTGSVQSLQTTVQSVLAEKDIKGLVILASDANGYQSSDVDPWLTSTETPIIGGIFPGLIHGKRRLDRGNIVIGLPVVPDIRIIPELSNPDTDYSTHFDSDSMDLTEARTMLVLVDGLATQIARIIDSLFAKFGLDLNYIGGGAGSLSFVQKPCIFTNKGLLADVAIIATLAMNSGIGVRHGWKSIEGPFKITKSHGNVVERLDWEPAFEVYKRIVEGASGQTFGDDNFFDIAKGFPFGLHKIGNEKVVRDPIAVDENGGLICVGNIPEGSYVDILQGDMQALIDAAEQASEIGHETYFGNPNKRTHLFIDCISRALYLQDHFEQELAAVWKKEAPTIGALTLGEIANSGQDYLEFYNKTAVLGVLEG